MKAKGKQSGVTLTEMVVVIAVVALLTSLSLPAAKTFFNSLGSMGGTKAMISAAMASARAIAAKEQRYAGIRFQNVRNANDPNPLKAEQYIIFIINDPTLLDADAVTYGYYETHGFRALEGVKPLKLPKTVGVMELVNNVAEIQDVPEITDKSTFTIVFSPSGKLVIQFAPVLRKNANDTVFNNVSVNPMFQDDYYDTFPFGQEQSRNSFTIYDKTLLDKLDAVGKFDYLQSLDVIYINAYTGTIISVD